MIKINPALLIKIHLLLAGFMLPVAIMFLTTGLLYFTIEFEGEYHSTPHAIELTKPLEQNETELSEIVIQELDKLKLKIPDGWSGIGKLDSDPGFQFEWHDGIDRIIILSPTNDSLTAKLIIKEASLYRKFLLLHTANGNNFFRLYASIFALVLFSMLVSGYLLGWRLKHHRKLILSSSLTSMALFILMVAIQ